MTVVRALRPEDASACDAIIAALPYFFGDPGGVAQAAEDVRRLDAWVTDDDGIVTGFLALDWPTSEATEIAWLAVHPGFRRGGRGSALVAAAVAHASQEGAKMMILFTSAADDPVGISDGYEGTRQFYSALGFVPVWVGGRRDWNEDHVLMAYSLQS